MRFARSSSFSISSSLAEDAYNTMLKIALKHGVGFFDVSGNGEVILSECDEQN